MFYSSTDGQYIQEGQSFIIDGVTYPPQWINQSTAEEKAAIGLEEVIATNSPADDRYYWVSTELNGASLTYVNTPKDLDTVKKNAVAQIKSTTFSILQPSDYVEARNIRDPNYKPEWITWRDTIRTESSGAVTAINAATDVDTIALLVQINWTPDPSQPKVN